MFSSILAAAFVAALAPQALANLYITSPVASTSCAAGQPCVASWNDDGNAPSLAQIGACNVGIWAGSQQTQYQLQDLGSVDVSTQATANFIPQAQIGGNSNLYFLRFTSVNFKDGANPWIGFSAKFTLTGMTGQFNETLQSLMTAPTSAIGSSTPAGTTTPAGTSTPAGTTTPAGSSGITTTTAKPSGSSTSRATSTATSSTGAAAPIFGSSSTAVALAAVVVSAFFAAAAF